MSLVLLAFPTEQENSDSQDPKITALIHRLRVVSFDSRPADSAVT